MRLLPILAALLTALPLSAAETGRELSKTIVGKVVRIADAAFSAAHENGERYFRSPVRLPLHRLDAGRLGPVCRIAPLFKFAFFRFARLTGPGCALLCRPH